MPLSTIKFSNISDNTKNLIGQNDLKLYSHNGNLYWNDKEVKTKPIINGIISLPPFIQNQTTTSYTNMYLAYQNLNTSFDYYIIPQNITITHISLFQSQETTAIYIIQIYNDTTQLGSDIEVEINPIEQSVRIKLDSDISLSIDNKLKIKIKDDGTVSDKNDEEVIIILDGYYGDNLDYTFKSTGNKLYYDVGNVGIGTTNPDSLLHLYNGSIKVENTINNSVIEITGSEITSYKNTDANSKKSVNINTNIGIDTTNDIFNINNISIKPILNQPINQPGSLTITNQNQISKLTNDADWNIGRAYTDYSFSNGCYLRFSAKNTNKLFTIGIRENNPNSDNTQWDDVGSTYYLWYIKHDSTLEIRNNGYYDNDFGYAVTYSNNIPFEILYDNLHIRYYYNGIQQAYYYVGANKTFYLDSSYYHTGNGIVVIEEFRNHNNEIPQNMTSHLYYNSKFNGIINTNSFTFNKTNVPITFNWNTFTSVDAIASRDSSNLNLFTPNLVGQPTQWARAGVHSNVGYTSSFLYKVKFITRNDKIAIGVNNNYLAIPNSFPVHYLRYLYDGSWMLWGEQNGNSTYISNTLDGSISNAGDIYDMYYINDKIYILKNNIILSYNIIDNILHSETFDLGVEWGYNTGNSTYTDIQKIEILEFKPVDYLTIPSYISPDLKNTNFTIEFWIKPQFTDKERVCTLFNQGYYSTDKWFCIYLDWNDTYNDNYKLTTKFGYNDIGATTFIPYILNIWTHICITYQFLNKELIIYINGSKRNTKTMERVLNSSGEIYLGKIKQENHNFPIDGLYKGELKQFKIWNDIRTQDELFKTSIKLTTTTIPITTDYDEILLINSNDIHNSQEFIDEAYGNFIFNSASKIGDFYNSMFICRHTNTEKKFGTTSIAFDTDDSNYDYLRIKNDNRFNFGSGDFTIELWFNIKSYTAFGTLISLCESGGGNNSAWSLNFHQEITISFATSSNGSGWDTDIFDGLATSSLALNTWYHLAVVRNGDNIKIYINGIENSSHDLTTSYSINEDNTHDLIIGCKSGPTQLFDGYMDSIRITKKALYTQNFILATSRFISRSKSYFNGIIGSSYATFDGIDDYLVIPNYDNKLDLCNSDFTIEFWIKIDYVSGNRSILYQGINGVHNIIQIYYNSSNLFLNFNSGQATFDLTGITIADWNHYSIIYYEKINKADCYVNASGPKTVTYFNGSDMGAASGKRTTASGNIKIGQSYLDDYIKADLRKLKIWNSVRTYSEIKNSCYYDNNGVDTFNTNILNNEKDSSYLNTISTIPINNLIVYIPFNTTYSNIYIPSYSSDFDTSVLHNNNYNSNLQIHIPMKSNEQYIYNKNQNKLKVDGYIKGDNVAFSAYISYPETGGWTDNEYHHITSDTDYTYNTVQIIWKLNYSYPNNNIFDNGKFTCPIDGLYDVSANIRFDNCQASTFIRLIVSINKNENINKMLHNIQGGISTYETLHISGCARLFKNDIVTLAFLSSGDTSFTIQSESTFNITLINTI